jgi:sialate O-acetylesterase
MIETWRETWAQGDFWFLQVQLANFKPREAEPGESEWAELQDAQRFVADTVPNCGMAVINDIGDAIDIHPRNKRDVGLRLARIALAKAYGRKVMHSGPVCLEWKVKQNEVRMRFDHAGEGLSTRDGGPVKGFAVAGKDRRFRWAEGRIEGSEVVVWSKEVPEPVAVRYGWAANPDCNLVNSEGLPAGLFRTDAWPGVTDGQL